MDEVWAILGISGCTTCLALPEDMGKFDQEFPRRSFADAKKIIVQARKLLHGLCGPHRVTEARELLKANRLTKYHLGQWCPFLFVPHLDFNCFPMDRLHGV
ncbi:MAG: hypothetical protein JW384_00222 [Nitrosomonadaceae bacterium]|nr:hypothetical protein [Nitrosomonadaceae bacterium]